MFDKFFQTFGISSFSQRINQQKQTSCQSAKRVEMKTRPNKEAIMLHEIYLSVQGEGAHAGLPCTFVRTQGCSLNCTWCDTKPAIPFRQSGTGTWLGTAHSIGTIVKEVMRHNCKMVEITGGEPLDQPAVPALITELCDRGFKVLVETAGHRDISVIDSRAHIIMDLKPPASGMTRRMRWQNLAALKPSDEIKFVLADKGDFEWAAGVISGNDFCTDANVLMSAVHRQLDPQELVELLLDSGIAARFQLQLHKYVWGVECSGV